MIGMLRGTLAEKGLDRVLLDVGGVGYEVAISMTTLQALPQAGHEVTLRTYLHVREDALQLFGFYSDEERRAFELCISVSGIGPKLALATLSGMDPGTLADAVRRGDVTRLCRIPGIGKKTAERMVLELRDKFGAPATTATPQSKMGGAQAVSSALVNLGYKPAAAERAAAEAGKAHPGAAVAELVKAALRILAE